MRGQFIESQGGDASYVYEPEKFEKASIVEDIISPETGYICAINCEEIGNCSLVLGGGRETKESDIDLAVGIILKKKKGAYVKRGDVLARIYGNDRIKTDSAKDRFLKAFSFSDIEPEQTAFIKGIVKA